MIGVDMANREQQGWNEWSIHVLQELKRLNEGQEGIRKDILSVKAGLSKLPVLDQQVRELRTWKDNMVEVCSPTQLAEMRRVQEELKIHKTKTVTIVAIIQIIFAILLGLVGMK